MSTARMTKMVNEYCDRTKLMKMLEDDFQERASNLSPNTQSALASKVHRIVRNTDASTQESVASCRQKYEKRDQHGFSSVNCESTETLYFPDAQASSMYPVETASSVYEAYDSNRYSSKSNAQDIQMQQHIRSLRGSTQ